MIDESDTSNIEVKCTLNSSFTIVDRKALISDSPMKKSIRNSRDDTQLIYPSIKKRKYNTDDSLQAQEIIDGVVIKDEILYSSPINSTDNSEQSKFTINTENVNKINIFEKHDKEGDNESNNDNSVEYKDILNELEDIEKNEEISDVDKEKLKNLRITLIHEVPPQHKVDFYAGSRAPTYRQQKLFKKYGTLRKGFFSPHEDEIIQKNWKMFCQLHKWDKKNVRPFLTFKYKGKFYIDSLEERQKFLQFLANGLPWRTLCSVYWRFTNLYRNHICKRYSPEEDEKILAYIQHGSTNENNYRKFSDLAKILKRTRHSIWIHYQYLKNKNDIKEHDTLSQICWTLPLINRYIKKLLKITKCQNIQELKDAIIPKVIWEKLQTKLNINYKILKQFWVLQLHMQLFCPRTIYLNDIKIQLIEYMYLKGISSKREIVWSSLIKYFDGMTSAFLSKIFSNLIKENDVIKYKRRSFLDAIEYLYEKKIPEIKEQATDKYLPQIQYHNGKIKIFDKITMNK